MTELEITQPEENLESSETTERVEEQALQDATHDPGAHVEETQVIEQAEAVEGELTEAINTAEQPAEDEIHPAESDPDPNDLPPGSGILEEPHETVGMVEDMPTPGLAGEAEVPEGIEFEPAGEDGSVDRDEPGMVDGTELSETPKDEAGKDEATPINLPGPVQNQGGDVEVSPIPVPLPRPADDGGGQVDQMPDPVPDPPEQSAIDSSGTGGNVPDELGVNMEPIPSPEERGTLPVPIPEPAMDDRGPGGGGSEVAATPINLPNPVDDSVEGGMGGRPGGDVSATPINLPYTPDADIALDHPGTGGNVAGHKEPGDPPPPPDMRGQTELTPDDVKMDENLQPTPDYEYMNPSERSVVEIIGKAIADEEYRATLFADARSAVAGYEVTDEDQTALGEMTEQAFDFFAAEVENRFVEAAAGISEAAKQQVLTQVVHAVWRDLNPGGLAYILAYKIPQKHL